MIRPPPPGYWAVAPTLAQFLRELRVMFPAVPRSSYGTIGDADHQARDSRHNPDDKRYVCAVDVPLVHHGGPPLDYLAEFIRQVGANQSQRMNPGGRVIWRRRVASARSQWKWVTYMGDSPHLQHLHMECSLLPHFYVLDAPWNVAANLDRLGWRPR